GACVVLEEQRGAADAAEGAHRRVDATGDVFLGVGEQGLGTGHGGSLSNQEVANSAPKARARASTSAAEGAENRAWSTASRSAPRAISPAPLSRLTPPMAVMGRAKRARAWSSSSGVALGAPGLVCELKKRPKAM